MKKAIIIIAAVAILGSIGLASRKHGASGTLSLSSNTSQTTSASTTNGTNTSSQTASSSTSSGQYKDGTFTGDAADTPYGTVQIAVVISGGKITDVNFLQMPSDMGHSVEVTQAAEPLLKQTTLQAQGPKIEFVSGATSTSYGYQESLQAALNQAQVS